MKYRNDGRCPHDSEFQMVYEPQTTKTKPVKLESKECYGWVIEVNHRGEIVGMIF